MFARALGVAPFTTDVTLATTTTTWVTRVIHERSRAWSRVDSNGKYIPALRVIQIALRAIKSEKVKQDSELRDVPLSGESYPDMTNRVVYSDQRQLADNHELVLQYLHRVYGYMPVARLRNILDYYRVDEIIQYPGAYKCLVHRHHICDICLRTGSKNVSATCQLDSEVFGGDGHAFGAQGPVVPAIITENTFKCGIIEYKSKYIKTYFIKSKDEVSKCIDDYCRYELAKESRTGTSYYTLCYGW